MIASAAFLQCNQFSSDSFAAAKTLRAYFSKRVHGPGVWSVFFHPSGEFFFTGGSSDVLIGWETVSGKPLGVFPPKRRPDGAVEHLNGFGGVNDAAIDPAGKLLAIASVGNVYVYELETGTLKYQLAGHKSGVNVSSVCFSPDGNLIATGSVDGTARIWQSQNGNALGVLDHNKRQVSSIQFTRNSRYLLTACYDSVGRVWDLERQQVAVDFTGHSAVMISARFSPDESTVLTSSWDATARVWDARSGSEKHMLSQHKGNLRAALFSPSGTRALTLSNDTSLLWDTNAWQLIQKLEHRAGIPGLPAFSADSRFLAVSTMGGYLYDATNGDVLATLEGEFLSGGACAFSFDSKRLVIAGKLDGDVNVWDLSALP